MKIYKATAKFPGYGNRGCSRIISQSKTLILNSVEERIICLIL